MEIRFFSHRLPPWSGMGFNLLFSAYDIHVCVIGCSRAARGGRRAATKILRLNQLQLSRKSPVKTPEENSDKTPIHQLFAVVGVLLSLDSGGAKMFVSAPNPRAYNSFFFFEASTSLFCMFFVQPPCQHRARFWKCYRRGPHRSTFSSNPPRFC